MLWKLTKYDLKSMLRTFLPLWILAPVVSLLFSLTARGSMKWTERQSGFMGRILGQAANIPSLIIVLIGLIFFGILVALAVVTVVFVLQRFWNGLLKEEGYLMFTLPVETWELITAKGICATLVSFISVVVGFVSFFLVLSVTFSYQFSWSWFWNEIAEILEQASVLDAVIFVLKIVILMILSLMKSIYSVYAAMALGQLFESHRVAGSIAFYFGLTIALTTLETLFARPLTMLEDFLYQLTPDRDWLGFFLLIMLTVVQIVIFHIITERVLSTRLNLE